MKTNGNDKALEAYKIFPYVAWIVTLGFAYFVYSIATQLQDTMDRLEIQTQQLEERVNTPVSEIKSFEN